MVHTQLTLQTIFQTPLPFRAKTNGDRRPVRSSLYSYLFLGEFDLCNLGEILDFREVERGAIESESQLPCHIQARVQFLIERLDARTNSYPRTFPRVRYCEGWMPIFLILRR